MIPIVLSPKRAPTLAEMALPAGAPATERTGVAFAALCAGLGEAAARRDKASTTHPDVEAEADGAEHEDRPDMPEPPVPEMVLPAAASCVLATTRSGAVPPVSVEARVEAVALPLPPALDPDEGAAVTAVPRAEAGWVAVDHETGAATRPSDAPGAQNRAVASLSLAGQQKNAGDGEASGAVRGEPDLGSALAANGGDPGPKPDPGGGDILASRDRGTRAGGAGGSANTPLGAAGAGAIEPSASPSVHRPAALAALMVAQPPLAAGGQAQPHAPAVGGTAMASVSEPHHREGFATLPADALAAASDGPPRRAETDSGGQPAADRYDRRPRFSQGPSTPAFPQDRDAPSAVAGVVRPVGAEAGVAPLQPAFDADGQRPAEESQDGGGAPTASGAILREAPVMRPVAAQAAGTTRQIPEAVVEYRGGEASLTLDPEELGPLRVTISQQDGGTLIHIVADRPDTADLMRRHADLLLRDLADSGIAQARISFGSGGDAAGGRDGNGKAPPTPAGSHGGEDGDAPATREIAERSAGRGRGLDMRV